jgi:hypothetical protein
MRNGIVWHGLVDDFRAVDTKHAGPAFSRTRPVVGELKDDCMLPRRKYLWRFPTEAFHVKQVVEKYGLALEQIESVPAEAPSERCNHSFTAALRDLNFCADGIQLVKQVRCEGWIDPSDGSGVRKHVLTGGMNDIGGRLSALLLAVPGNR